MNYSQFVKLNNLLESNNYTLEDLKKTNNLVLIKEETKSKDGELETKSAVKDIASPRKALMRKKLNSNAKTLQDGINKNLGDKYIKPLVKQRIELYNKMIQMGSEKPAKEIAEALKDDLVNMKKIQDKQLTIIEKAAETIINNSTRKINSAIEKSSMKDSNKAELASYWALLCVQIQSNLLKKLYVMNKDILNKIAPDEKARQKADAILKATVDKETLKKEQELNKLKEQKIKDIKTKESAVEQPDSEDQGKNNKDFSSQEDANKKEIEK